MDQVVPLPHPTDWHTVDQLLTARPFLTARTVRHWCEKREVRYSKRGSGVNAVRLFKLADIDEVVDRYVVETGECAPNLAGWRRCNDCGLVTTPGPLATHQRAKQHVGWTVAEDPEPEGVIEPEPVTVSKRRCGECDVVTDPGPLGRHQSATGHQGWLKVELAVSS